MIKPLTPENTLKWFFARKEVKQILPNTTSLHPEIIGSIIQFMKDRLPDTYATFRIQLAHWINGGVSEWERTYELLTKTTCFTPEWFDLRYGVHAKQKKDEHYGAINNLNPVFWQKRGLTYDQAVEKIKQRQIACSHKGAALKRGVSTFTPRSVEFWIARGLSQNDAAIACANFQRRDLVFYQTKYGESEGKQKFDEIKKRRKQTWESKDKIAHSLKTLPTTNFTKSQEYKVIQRFLTDNHINEDDCMFGSPSSQFWQQIPGVGFRRYDLAIFDHSELKFIVEFHGIGHINFSEFNEEMRFDIISNNGAKLKHLGTYGEVYDNDMIKRNHILTKFPDCKYIVIWPHHIKRNQLLIEDLLK